MFLKFKILPHFSYLFPTKESCGFFLISFSEQLAFFYRRFENTPIHPKITMQVYPLEMCFRNMNQFSDCFEAVLDRKLTLGR